jgi:AcrR family transcriptional regulator
MTDAALPTRQRILHAAAEVFATDGIRAGSMDRVAALAGITKRTLYYHVRSKDDLLAACLEAAGSTPADWLDGEAGSAEERLARLLRGTAQAAAAPRWRGAFFLRAAFELAELPGHPARRLAVAHQRRMEARLAELLRADGIAEPAAVARAVMLVLNGLVAQLVLTRDPGAVATALDLLRPLLRPGPRARLAA